jgi:hypothetical protein
VSFSVVGLPPGATFTFSPTSVGVTGGAQTVTLAIQTPARAVAAHLPPITSAQGAGTLFAVLVLPLLLRRRPRSNLLRGLLLALVCCGSLLTVAGLTGCASGTSSKSSPVISTMTVTATSGTVQHSAIINLVIQ